VTLLQRVLLFFLTALAMSLVLLAGSLYFSVAYSGERQFQQQLQATLQILVAAIEVELDDVKWEPSDHTISLGLSEDPDEIRWAVFATHGVLVDHSRNLNSREGPDAAALAEMRQLLARSEERREHAGWITLKKHLAAPEPKPPEDWTVGEFDQMTVLVSRSYSPLHRQLWNFALLLTLSCGGVWSLSAILGTWYCRRLLAPVRLMADAAHSITGDDPSRRLPIGPHSDELSQLALSFNDVLDRLEEAFERQRRFSGDAAHQLRTPLTVLLGQIDVALRRPRSVAEYQETLQLLRRQTVELQQIIEALLFLTQTDENATPPATETIDLAKWLAEFVQRYQFHPRHHDLILKTASPVWMTTSPGLLQQLLENLVNNAFKYSEPGSEVCLSTTSSHQGIVLEVEDQGIGISANDLHLVFTPFFRSTTARQRGTAGTGLGLALAARIARSLNATLQVDSHEGVGTRFRCQFQLSPPEEFPDARVQSQPIALSQTLATPKTPS